MCDTITLHFLNMVKCQCWFLLFIIELCITKIINGELYVRMGEVGGTVSETMKLVVSVREHRKFIISFLLLQQAFLARLVLGDSFRKCKAHQGYSL